MPGAISPHRGTVAVPIGALMFVTAGSALRLSALEPRWSTLVWSAGLIVTGIPVVWRTLRGMARGHFASDIVATLAIVGAVLLQQPLAGLIVVLMQTGGEALERFAEGRASRAVQALEADAPRIAHRLRNGATEDIPVDAALVGDDLLVRPGEMIPCDSIVLLGRSHVDTSRLTGEALPVSVEPGQKLASGMLNGDGALTVRVSAVSRESQYERIVELVRTAARSKAPLQRLADRYAVWFTPLTLIVCAVAWVTSGDPARALAVLVVATPCPLILATPIAIIGGINRAASRQIIMRTGAALERLEGVSVAVFDKTGTITVGRPEVAGVQAVAPMTDREVLRLAGAVEQYSSHPLARGLVDAASRMGPLPAALDVREAPGRGVFGIVEGRRVAVGSRGYTREQVGGTDLVRWPGGDAAALRAGVVIDGQFAGTIEYADRIRPEASRLITALHRDGIRDTLLLSGDSTENTAAAAHSIGIDHAEGDLFPAEKEQRVAELSRTVGKVMMVGDGTNDAPALGRADVGIALAGHGGGITAEAADIVILVDDLGRVAEALAIGRRTMRIARQSIWVGLSLSGAAMLIAAAGYIPPVIGALVQEAIDVAVIVNALRASRSDGRPHSERPAFPDENGGSRRHPPGSFQATLPGESALAAGR